MNNLVEQLAAADNSAFARPAVPAVYAEYEAFLATGRYPYLDDVVTDIAKKYRVADYAWAPNQQFHHEAAHDFRRATGCDLLVKLHHEAYLASGQHRLAEMVALETSLRDQGFRPITDLDPVDGMKISFPDGTVYRLKADGPDWTLLLPRQRTQGESLRRLQDRQRAFEEAKQIGQTRMNDPRVVVFKPTAA